MNQVRWGLLSTARINRRLIPAIRASARGTLVAVASRSQAAAERYAAEWDIPQAFGSYEALLDSGAVDAVYIGLPNHLHATWTIRALQAGVHVLCEKPFAISLAEVDDVFRAAAATGRVVAQALMYRHHPQTKLARDWVAQGRLGDVTLVRGVFNFKLHDRDNVRLSPEMGGGCLWDVGIYPLSYAQYVMGGPPAWVSGLQWIGDSGVDEVFAGQMGYPGGGVAQISSAFHTPFHTSAEIFGTAGRLFLDSPFLVGVDGRPHEMVFYPADGAPEVIPVPEADLYVPEVDDMNDAILDGTPTYLTATETREHVRTILALYEAARTQQIVVLR